MPSDLMQTVVPGLIEHIPITLVYWFVPSVLSLLFGTLLCIVRVGRHNVLYWICTIYISFFRGTPGIVQIYLVFFGLPKLFWIFGIDINDWSAGIYFIIATTMNLSCFMCETLRGGYVGMDKGQIETGLSIGFSRTQNFFRVIAPQTLKVAILNLKNLEIDVLKDTSVAFTIGAVEMLGYAKGVIAASYGSGQLWILGAAAVIYFVMCTVLEIVFTLISHRMERYERRVA
ncbi:amino acid ABC transporter permease [Bifidobacterium simiarum]|uniref:amino acid ABC transporter permease n=1 Tax=Bifidobacterium simiarum TaxID=2045441 RepID=UPI001BDD7DD5|nr:amino acid ABC transporter permease [Bifidobacterium simiarum]MBT1165373.1 amino acid ABC transporter permease [Bifidobacterium simiarum]